MKCWADDEIWTDDEMWSDDEMMNYTETSKGGYSFNISASAHFNAAHFTVSPFQRQPISAAVQNFIAAL
jgi:hypothetical protein